MNFNAFSALFEVWMVVAQKPEAAAGISPEFDKKSNASKQTIEKLPKLFFNSQNDAQ